MPRYSKIVLSKNIQIDKTHKNVLNYNSTQMLEVMRSNAHFVNEASNYSFIQNGKISVGFTYNECLGSNYIAFQNPTYSAKWFFAFIDRVEYESNNSTIIYYTIDNWATWFEGFVGSMKPCYVIREHTNNDTIGANTIDEGLAIQDVVSELSETDSGLGSMFYIGVTSNWNVEDETGYNGVTVANRGIFGSRVCLFPFNSVPDAVQLLNYLLQVNAQGHIDDVHDIFIIPYALISPANLTEHEFDVEIGGHFITTGTYYTITQASFDDVEYDWNVAKTHSFSDYTPRNNKCFCYPYNYLYVSNNAGDSNILKYEDFSNGTHATFKVQLALSIGCSGRIVPTGYKGINENLSESVSLGKYPTCQWSADSYTNWLTQNAVNLPVQFMSLGLSAVSSVASIGASAAAGTLSPTGVINSVGNLAAQIGGIIGEFYQAQLLPERVTGTNTADVNFASDDNTFKLSHMRVKTEYLKEIDDYFTRFGYKTMRVKVPNITGRQLFNYIEIGQGERFAYGEIPPDALDEINQIAQNGVTIWHDHANVGRYNLSNNII